MKAPPPLTQEGQPVVAWNLYHTLMLSSFCRRSSPSRACDRAAGGSPWLCFVPEEPQSQRGDVVEGNFLLFLEGVFLAWCEFDLSSRRSGSLEKTLILFFCKGFQAAIFTGA